MKHIEILMKLSVFALFILCAFYLKNDPNLLFDTSSGGIRNGIVETSEGFKQDSIYSFESIVWALNDNAKENERTAKETIVQTFYKEVEYSGNKIYLLLLDKTLFVQLNDTKAEFYGDDPRAKQRFNDLANKEPELLLKEIKNIEVKKNNRPDFLYLKAGESIATISDIRPNKIHVWEMLMGEIRGVKYITDYTDSYKKFAEKKGKGILVANFETVLKAK